jgi:hypothetical protein
MTGPKQLRQTVDNLLASQAQGVLATQHDQQPYTSLMAFAVTPDLRRIVFATYRATQKHANLLANPRVSLLISAQVDYHGTVAISAHGIVSEINAARHDELLQLYLRKHPELRCFVTAADCILLQLEVEPYYIVSQFQNVDELQMT